MRILKFITIPGSDGSDVNNASPMSSLRRKSVVSFTPPDSPNQASSPTRPRGFTIQDLMKDSVFREKFRKFAQEEFSEENVLFWLEVQMYKTVPSERARREIAKRIYDKFVPPEASMGLNFSKTVVDECKHKMEMPTVDSSLFDRCQAEVEITMNDTLERFLRSPKSQ